MSTLPMQLGAHACYAFAVTRVVRVRQDGSAAIVPQKECDQKHYLPAEGMAAATSCHANTQGVKKSQVTALMPATKQQHIRRSRHKEKGVRQLTCRQGPTPASDAAEANLCQ